ncbi:unnamed protein product [Echinostoma caproni]|uniref:ASH domain-containing protein n=1 Tax=Echinostoma caproni TaxID=27848 RepID=A0A183A6D3_9TREM|nr:unnamed protein product [Echinostoma caproni]
MKIRFTPKIEERQELEMEWKKLMAKNQFLRNPRYEVTPINSSHPIAIFGAEPKIIEFTSYRVGTLHETQVKVRNISKLTRSMRILPPRTVHFSLGRGKFPEQKKSAVAPGMAVIFTVQFRPETLGDYEDELVVEYEAQTQPLVIPIHARRPRAGVNFPDIFHLDHCLLYDRKSVLFQLHSSNRSPDADTRFILLTMDEFEAYQNEGLVQFDSYWSKVMQQEITRVGSFSVRPSRWTVTSDQSEIRIQIDFWPITLGEHKESVFIAADNGDYCPARLKGIAENAHVQLESIDQCEPNKDMQTFRCVTETSELCVYLYLFPVMYPHTAATKLLVIRNLSHSELSYEWIITDQTLSPDSGAHGSGQCNIDREISTPFEDSREEKTVDVFGIHPKSGLLQPDGLTSFEAVCSPSKVGEFFATFRLVLTNVPALHETNDPVTVEQEPIELEFRAKIVELPVFLEPNVLILPGKHLLGVPIHRYVKLRNGSAHCPITFCWQSQTTRACIAPNRSMISNDSEQNAGIDTVQQQVSETETLVVFEPALGEILPGDEILIDVCISSSSVGRFMEKLACHIDCLPRNPLWLHLECDFQAPKMLTDQSEYNLGPIRLGDSVCKQVVITNPAPTIRQWKIRIECGTGRMPDEVIRIEPNQGILEPFNSHTLRLSFKPVKEECVRYFLRLTTADTTEPVSRQILAEVQTPMMDILPPNLHLDQLFRSVPQTAEFTLINLMLLEADFCWLSPSGEDAKYVDLEILPPTGKLFAHERRKMKLTITCHKQKSIEDLIVPCEIQGMTGRLELHITGHVEGLNVNVRRSRPRPGNADMNDWSPTLVSSASMFCPIVQDSELSMGDEMLLHHPVSFWIEIHNPTPINATVLTEVKHFGIKKRTVEPPPHYNPPIGVYDLNIQDVFNHSILSASVQRNSEVLLMEQRQSERRLFFDWCSAFLKQTAGACLFAHSGLVSHDDDPTECKIVSPVECEKHTEPRYFAQSRWNLPAQSRIRICFVLLVNMWGRYKDTVDLRITSVGNYSNEPEPPVVQVPICYTFVGCPIVLVALRPFGQVINSISRQLGTTRAQDLGTQMILPEANRYHVCFGSRSPDDQPVVRQIKLYNSSSSTLRIDWQIFLDAPVKKTDQLLDVVCFTTPVFSPDCSTADTRQMNDCDDLYARSCNDSGPEDIVKLLVHPHDGQLIWQSSGANIAPVPKLFNRLFTIRPEQLLLRPLEEGQVAVVFDPIEAVEMIGHGNRLSVKARALGQLTDESNTNKVVGSNTLYRTLALETDRITLDISADLEKPVICLDVDDCPLIETQQSITSVHGLLFSLGIGELLSQLDQNRANRARTTTTTSKPDQLICASQKEILDPVIMHAQVLALRSFRLRSANHIPVRVQFTCPTDSHFGFLRGADEDKLRHERLYAEMIRLQRNFEVLLKPEETRKITVALQITPSDLSHLTTAKPPSIDDVTVEDDHMRFESQIKLQVCSAEQRASVTQDRLDPDSYTLHLRGHITRTRFHLYPQGCVDFGTVYLGEAQHSQLRLCNQSATRAWWTVIHVERTAFCADESGEINHVVYTKGRGRKIGSFEEIFVIRGVFGEPEIQIHVRGQGSSDEKYRSLLGK